MVLCNDMEKVIVVIWQDVLNVEKVGIFDNFFEMGGYLLKVMMFLIKVYKEIGVDILF